MGLLALPGELWTKAGQYATYQRVPSSPYAPSESSLASSSDDSDSLSEREAEPELKPDVEQRERERSPRAWLARRDPALITIVILSLGCFIFLLIAFPLPTSIHVFLSVALGITSWTFLQWIRLGHTCASSYLRGGNVVRRWTTAQLSTFVVFSALAMFWLSLGIVPPAETVPSLVGADGGGRPRYFIAANLYNNEDIVPQWTEQLIKAIEHLGPENTFVSIYESNSVDKTPEMLVEFGEQLTELAIPHRIISDTTERWWPYGTSPERIGFLSKARNRALEPLQSPDASIRLADYDSFTKIIFLNDVVYTWQAVIRLLATSIDGTPGEDGYDLACGTDLHKAGLYDTWVARDICGTPMRIFWPYVKDPVSKQLLWENKPFEVAACWNGMVAFPAAKYLYRPPAQGLTYAAAVNNSSSRLAKRGWKVIDNTTFPDHRMSPPLPTPIKFRTTGVDACDHSECFLFSYDLHRMYNTTERPPRIIMNPDVMLAYNRTWWVWNNVILRAPFVKWWVDYWARGVGLWFIEWLIEFLGRRRDYCTWSAFEMHLPDRCPPLPYARELSWEQQ